MKKSVELFMDAVENAGRTWVEAIKKEVAEQNDKKEKLKTLAAGYAMGTKDYPESLSVYIDLWKIVKDKNNEYVKTRLKNIYNFYISEFYNIIKQIDNISVKDEEIHSFSTWMTVLSDVLHIQSITLENDIDLKSIQSVIEKIAVLFFLGDSNE